MLSKSDPKPDPINKHSIAPDFTSGKNVFCRDAFFLNLNQKKTSQGASLQVAQERSTLIFNYFNFNPSLKKCQL